MTPYDTRVDGTMLEMRRVASWSFRALLIILAFIYAAGWVVGAGSHLSLFTDSDAVQVVFGVQVSYGVAERVMEFKVLALFICGPMLLLLGLPFALFTTIRFLIADARAERRARMGLCWKCGYDLRASSAHFSECGTLINSARL